MVKQKVMAKQKIFHIALALLVCTIVLLVAFRGMLFSTFLDSPVTIDQHVSSAPSDSKDGKHAAAKEGSLTDVLQLAREIQSTLAAEVQDYQGVLLKRERIGGALGSEVKMQFKIRHQSANTKLGEGQASPRVDAYLKFESPPLATGREVIWRAGWNDGMLVVHEGGLKNWTRMNLLPDSTLAMLGNKYPITEIGIAKLIEKLIEKGERDSSLSQAQVAITKGHQVGMRDCERIEVRFDSPAEGVDFHIAQIFIDLERGIPLRYAAYMWPPTEGAEPPLEEEYTYLDVKLNVGLTDEDFNPDNPGYQFP